MSELPPAQGRNTTHLQINRHSAAGEFVVELHGEMDVATAGSVADVLAEVEGLQVTRIVIDLTALEFMDSSGLRVLVEARNRSLESGPELAIRLGSGQVERLFARTGLSAQFTLVG